MILVVTGGIGSGKSTVCNMLRDNYGFPVYEADSKAKELYDRYPDLLASIESTAGRSLRNSEGCFQPSVLAEIIFSDRRLLEKVEDLLFPFLKHDFDSWRKEHHDSSHHGFESATILEKPQFEGFGDLVLLVDAPFVLRLERASSRSNAKEDVIRQRMQNQILMNQFSDGLYDDRIDHVIINDGSISDLSWNVADFIEKYSLT